MSTEVLNGMAAAWRVKAPGLVDEVKALLPDYEAAADKEWDIFHDFVAAVAEHNVEWGFVARELLKIGELKFPRWG